MWWAVGLVAVAIIGAVVVFLRNNKGQLDDSPLLDDMEDAKIYDVTLEASDEYNELKEKQEENDGSVTHRDLMKCMLKRAKEFITEASRLSRDNDNINTAKKTGVCHEDTWKSWVEVNRIIKEEHESIQTEAEELKVGWGQDIMKLAQSMLMVENRSFQWQCALIARAKTKVQEGKQEATKAKVNASKRSNNANQSAQKSSDKAFKELMREEAQAARKKSKKGGSKKKKPKAD